MFECVELCSAAQLVVRGPEESVNAMMMMLCGVFKCYLKTPHSQRDP